MALHHASPGEVVDLSVMGHQPQQSRTVAIVKTDRFEAIRCVLKRGETIPSHQVASKITLHCLEGAVIINLIGEPLSLHADQWVFFDENTVHGIEAAADAVLLMTIMLPVTD